MPGTISPLALILSTIHTILPSDKAFDNNVSRSGAPGSDLAFSSLSVYQATASRSFSFKF